MSKTGAIVACLFPMLVSACGPSSTATQARSDGAASGNPSANRTLVYVTDREPVHLAPRGLHGHGGVGFFGAGLTMTADQGLATELELAEAFPQLGTDSWKVLPDGRMEVAWRLRPNLTWHDGTPITAEDFVFGYRLSSLPQSDTAGIFGTFLEKVTAPDPRTVVIHWKSPYPTAAEEDGTVPAYPRHLLAASFEQLDFLDFAALPHWSTQFVGTGPYRLDKWEPGAFIQGVSFPGYALGAPNIGRLKITWMADPNTMVASALAGGVHYISASILAFEQALVLKHQWVTTGQGQLAYNPIKTRYLQIQHKPDYVSPAALQDVRVRQALVHATDKQALVEAMVDGEPAIAHTFLGAKSPYFADVDKVLAKYPYDPRRSEQLLTEAGLRKDPAGGYAQRDGSPFSPEIAFYTGLAENEALVVQDSWKRVEVAVPIRVIPPNQQRDLSIISTYPAFRIDQLNADRPGQYLHISNCGTAERGWIGNNRGCFNDAEYNRLWDTFLTSLDGSERATAMTGAMKLLSEKVASIPMYYNYNIIGFSSSLVGPTFGITNVYQWRFQQ